LSVKSAKVADWLGLIRFSHTIFALPFAALATVMALTTPMPGSDQTPNVRIRDLIGIVLCMVLARSAAMAINRLLDQDIDAENPRTSGRHLPAGIISRKSVWFFTIACSVGFVAATLCFLPNWLPLAASVPVLIWLCGYSLAKRFTSAAHLWLGVALSLSPICAWVAIRGISAASVISDYAIPISLAASVIAWVTGFDILYACQDADYDKRAGLHSVPARFGIAGALRIAAMCHAMMLPCLLTLAYVGRASGLGPIFAVSLIVIAALVIYQHRLVRPDDLSRVNEAFFQTNAVISLLLLGVGTIDCLW
jgi:4-hydroxybenzoate polyprenyltransferase